MKDTIDCLKGDIRLLTEQRNALVEENVLLCSQVAASEQEADSLRRTISQLEARVARLRLDLDMAKSRTKTE